MFTRPATGMFTRGRIDENKPRTIETDRCEVMITVELFAMQRAVLRKFSAIIRTLGSQSHNL